MDHSCVWRRQSVKVGQLPRPPLPFTAAFHGIQLCHFAAEAECSPEVQDLFSAALLPHSSQNLKPGSFMGAAAAATIDSYVPKPLLPCQ